jgi:DNA-binding transcriptional regulator YdaS (Cro superfamily)
MSEAALKSAIKEAGGRTKLAVALGIKPEAISQWRRCPVLRVLDVERLSGVSRHELRPDIYPVPEFAA